MNQRLTVSFRVAPWFQPWVKSYIERALEPDEDLIRLLLHCAVEVQR